jgi:hypothetical protein
VVPDPVVVVTLDVTHLPADALATKECERCGGSIAGCSQCHLAGRVPVTPQLVVPVPEPLTVACPNQNCDGGFDESYLVTEDCRSCSDETPGRVPLTEGVEATLTVEQERGWDADEAHMTPWVRFGPPGMDLCQPPFERRTVPVGTGHDGRLVPVMDGAGEEQFKQHPVLVTGWCADAACEGLTLWEDEHTYIEFPGVYAAPGTYAYVFPTWTRASDDDR